MPFSRGSGQSTNGVLKNEAMGGTEVTAIPVSLATTRVGATSRLSGRAVARQSGSAVTTELAGIPGPKYSAQSLQTSLSPQFIQVIEPLMFVARPAACGVLRLGTHPAGCKTLWPRPPRCAKLKSQGRFCLCVVKEERSPSTNEAVCLPCQPCLFKKPPEQNHVLPVSNTLSQDLKNYCGW
jgi:hypothetical protein